MSKTKDELLAAYKKASKPARLVMIGRANCSSEQEYFAYLEALELQTVKKGLEQFFDTKPDENLTIHNVHIVDVSGSMAGLKLANAVKGINEELNELRQDKTAMYTQTIVEFSDYNDIKTIVYKQALGLCPVYSAMHRGMTALNQAIGETLERLSADTPVTDKVLVKIFTDGQENNSRGKYSNKHTLSQLIKECEARGFTVTFVGTQEVVDYAVQDLMMFDSNTLVHDNSPVGIAATFTAMRGATRSYALKAKKGKDVTKDFYSKQLGTLED